MTAPSIFAAAPWGRPIRMTTIVLVVSLPLLSASLVAAGAVAQTQSYAAACVLLAASCLPAAMLLLLAALGPRAYRMDENGITVLRWIRSVRVPLEKLGELRIMEGGDVFRGAVRSMGCGGAFGVWGQFYSPELRTFLAYVTSLDKVVLIKLTKGFPVVVSPDRPEEFVAAVEAMRGKEAIAGGATGGTGRGLE